MNVIIILFYCLFITNLSFLACKKIYDSKTLNDCDNGCGRGVKYVISVVPKETTTTTSTTTTTTTTTTDSPLGFFDKPNNLLFNRVMEMMNDFKERSRQMLANTQTIKGELPPLPIIEEDNKEVEATDETKAEKMGPIFPRDWMVSSRIMSISITPNNAEVFVNNAPNLESMFADAMDKGILPLSDPASLKVSKVIASVGRVGEKPMVIETTFDSESPEDGSFSKHETVNLQTFGDSKGLFEFNNFPKESQFKLGAPYNQLQESYYNPDTQLFENKWADCLFKLFWRSVFILLFAGFLTMVLCALLSLKYRRTFLPISVATISTSGRPGTARRLSNLKVNCKANR